MQCYSELLPPSTVTHAVTLCLINEGVQTLVLAKTSLLQVFELRQASGHKTHLSLIGEYELSGTVIALQKIRTKDSINDSLLIACRDAKISLVQWDHVNHRIATISIHYYESEPVPRQPCDTGATFARSILTVDPASRCVALKFGLRQLAILPFKQQGEDLQELDEDMDEARPEKLSADGGEVETPYKKSLVLSLPSLDEELTDVVDIAFLHNYREPTFGIISTKNQASMGLYSEDQHAFRYQILALDLEQAASTVLATVEDLPIGLWKVVPMPLPVGGALLIGTNEVLHVAQSGKTHAVIINEFASLSTKFSTSEQVSLNYKLEDCVVELLDNESNDVLFVLRDGSLAVLHLTLLGPDVKSMKFKSIPADAGGNTVQGLPSCAAAIGSEHVFLGSDESDSHLMRWQHVSLARKRSHADMLDEEDQVNDASEDDANDDDMEDDDLYSNATRKTRSNAKQSSSSSQTMAYHFEALDVLPSVGPIESVCFGKSTVNESPNVEMIAVTGRQRGSRLTKLSRGIQPVSKRSRRIDGARSVWSLRAVKPKNKKAAPSRGADNLLFVSDGSSTSPYKVDSDDSEPEELTGTEFEHDGQTLDIGTLGQGRWIAHCRQAEIRIYEPDLSLSQIIPMVDEGTDAELSIVSTSFADPYLMVLRNDSSMQVLKYDSKSHDVEPLDTPQAVAQRKFVSGNLYKSEAHHGIISAIMLSAEGSLDIYSLPQLELIYTLQNAAYTPAILAPDAPTRRTGQKDTLTEVLMVDLGPQHMRKPYLLLRNAVDELAFYEPFYNTKPKVKKWTEGMRFRKVPVPHVPKYEEETEDDSKQAQQMRPLEIGTHAAVSIPGKLQHLILCTPQSRPKVLPVRFEKASALVARGQFEEIKEGRPLSLAVLTDNGSLHECDIPDTISWSSGWTTQPLQFELDLIGDIRGVTFHEQSGMYVVSTCRVADFLFATDDTRHPEQDEISSRPQVQQYTIHLYSAKTHRIISSYEFEPGELVTSLEVVAMDVSEHTHEVKPMICVGLAILKGEDMPARGSLVIFQVLPVVSEPNDPETGIKLHVQSKENVKGAVTTLAPFVGGLVGISQGQKIMVRGLKEDGSCLPVAFLDCECQLATLKTLWKTGLWLAGDSWKGLWLGGFTEDPYKLTFLGKTRPHMEVICAEFLPFRDQLFVLVVDADMDLHVLQYDPEDPKTVAGTRLLHRGTFNIGHWPTSMTLVPSTLATVDEQAMSDGDNSYHELFQVLITTQSGSIALITPLESVPYRRLGNLHGQLVSVLEQPAALNPRQYRASEGDSAGSRGIIDGTMIQRIGELGSAKRGELLSRCGSDAWTLRSDLEIISGGGLTWM